MRKLQLILIAVFFAWLPINSQAEQSQDFGDYVVHFNAIPTSFLQPDIAKQYRIIRSRHRAMVNITVLHKVMGTAGTPVHAKVTGSAVNLTGQVKDLTLREVREANAIYYVGEVRIANSETLNFTVSAKPEGVEQPLEVRFRQTFYTD